MPPSATAPKVAAPRETSAGGRQPVTPALGRVVLVACCSGFAPDGGELAVAQTVARVTDRMG